MRQPKSRFGCLCNGSTDPIWISRRWRLISSGKISTGDNVRIVPSGRNTTIKSIVTQDGALSEAIAGQSVTLTFNDEVDCSRGDVVALADNPPAIADRFEATLVWMAEDPLVPRRGYWLKIGTVVVPLSSHPNIRLVSTRWSILQRKRWI